MRATGTGPQLWSLRALRSACTACLLTLLAAGSVTCGARAIGASRVQSPQGGPSVWHRDFETALREARRRGRPLLLHFYADWCGPCQIMEVQVLQAPAVRQQIGRDFVAVKVDFDRRGDVARRYGVQVLPADLILAPDGRILARSEGLTGSDAYRRRLAATAAAFRRENAQPAGRAVPSDRVRPDGSSDETLLADSHAPGEPPRPKETEDPAPAAEHDRRDAANAASGADRRHAALGHLDEPASPDQSRFVEQRARRTRVPSLPDIELAWRTLNERGRTLSPEATPTRPAPAAASTEDAADRPADGGVRPDRHAGPPAGNAPPVLATASVRPEPHHNALPAGNDEAIEPSISVGLEGYSPVALYRHRQWVRGQRKFAHSFRGITYYLASAEELEIFRQDPVRYAPRLQGCDPVVLYDTDRAIPGSVQFAAYFDGELYLFVSEATRRRFEQDPLRYTRTRHVRGRRDMEADSAS